MSFLGGFGKGFAIGYNADVAATKAADLEATKYNLQLTAAASQKKRTDDSANTIDFGALPTGQKLNYIRAYNSKGATQHADNIRGLNELANTTIDIEYSDGTTEESNYGNYLLKQYNDPKTRANVEPVVNNIMREYKNEFANYEKLMMPSGADSKGKVFNINKALGLNNLNPMFTLMNKKMVANKYKEAGINVLGDSRMPEYVNKDFTFTIKGADTVENGTVIKEGKSVPITIKSNESKAMLEKMAANTGLSVKQFLNINVNSNNRDLNDVLEIDNKGEKTVRASLILGNLHGAIREGRLDQINTETFTELTKLFLNPKDENNYLGTIDENAPKNAIPDRLSALNNLVDAVAYHLPDNIGREVSVEDSMFLVKKDTTSPTAIKAALSRHGYKNPEEVKQSFNNANKVYSRITRMFEMIEQVEGDGSAPTGSVITGITVLGRGIFDLPSQLTNVLGNEGSGEKTNFLMRMVNGKVSQYGSEKTYNRFLKRSDEGKESYKKFLIANVRGEGGSGRTFNSMADLNSKYVQYRKEKGLGERSSFTGAELKKLKEFDKSYAAIMQMHSYLLAFEMAAAAQGGGDSRTISDRDVRIMQNVIFSKFMSTGDFKGVLGEIQETMAMFRETHGVFSHAIQQGKGPAHIAVAGKLTAAGGPINSGKDVRENFQASIMDMAQGTQLLNQNGILIEGAEDSLYEKEYGGSDVEVNEPDVSESMNMSVQDLAQFNAPGTDQKIGDVFRTIEDKAVTNQMEFLQEDIDYILELIDKGVAAADPISPVSFYNLIGNPTLKNKLQQAYEKRGNNQLGDISQEEMDEIDNSPEARAANIYRKNSLNMGDN